MSKTIKFPITACPYCKHDKFHNNIGMHGVTRVTYDNQGQPIATKVLNMNYSDVRESWYCNNCEEIVFTTRECS